MKLFWNFLDMRGAFLLHENLLHKTNYVFWGIENEYDLFSINDLMYVSYRLEHTLFFGPPCK